MTNSIALWPEAASTTAVQVDYLLLLLLTVCGSVGLLVACLLIGFSVRYRRSRMGGTLAPPETRESHLLEWSWTLSPLVFFAAFFFLGSEIYFSAYTPPADAMPVYVVAKQWMWKFQHPGGQREINTLHVPAGQPIKIHLISEDVIHSFFVPAFRIHMDALPGRYTTVWFEATHPGTYHLFCSQYCGSNHAKMVGKVIVMSPSDYQRWLESGADGSLAVQGGQIFLKHRCLSCHSADESARAPVLESIFGRPVPLQDNRVVSADEAYLRESILNPSAKVVAGYQDIMPPFQGQLDEQEIIALIAYLESLGGGETPSRVESFPPPQKKPSEVPAQPVRPQP